MRRRTPRVRVRWASTAVALLSAALWSACSDVPESPVAPGATIQAAVGQVQERDVGRALEAQQRHGPALLAIPGVVGHGVGLGANGEPAVLVFTLRPGASGIPDRLDGVATRTVTSGRFVALTEETDKLRPAPLGASIGHPDITAGTLGFKVKDASGNAYILSNNHVMANSNDASAGDNILQPGPFDGGSDPADKIGTLTNFVRIDFSGANNVVDAAIAQVPSADVLSSTPNDEGYGQPSSTTVVASLNMGVQKYGRTTEHTQGTVAAINATVDVCYEPQGIFGCAKLARFVNQIIITPGTFSAGGDSGSGIVTNDGNLNPVGLLFAGSSSYTIANPIGPVLSAFGVTVDDGDGSEPPPSTDIEIANVGAPSTAVGGDVVAVSVTVHNAGNQDVGTSFEVTLQDVTDGVVIGSQSLPGLSAGASAGVNFSWDTNGATFGDHVLVAAHAFADDEPTNDQDSTTVDVTDPNAPSGVHVGDLDAVSQNDGSTWSAIVEVAVHGPGHELVNGATVVGVWSEGAFASDTCTTGELGGNGTCIFLNTLLGSGVGSVTFTVTSVTLAGETYQAGLNHDADGDSDGTSVTAQNPTTPNDPPAANDVAAVGDEDAASIPWTPDASDPNGDALSCSIVSQPANGSATMSADCSSGTYTPAPDFNGLDAFTYSASDGASSDQGAVSVTVHPINDAPTAGGDAYDAIAGTTLNVPAAGVLGNDGDVDGDALTAVLDVGPSNASSFTLNADGSFSYASDTEGADSFTYHASDGSLDSDIVTVTITVTAPEEGVTVTAVEPGSVQAGGSVAVTITGTGFVAGAAVTFESGNGPAPTAANVVVVDANTITATFSAKGGGPRGARDWDVRVTNPDGSTGALAGGFTVTR